MSDLRFDNKVVIVTGAGNGLGKAYALEFARRGARVVVNDLGGSFKGEGASKRAADVVVSEIEAAGGEAVANYDSVEYGERIVKTAVDKWGRVDVVVNNAGILRDVSFAKMKDADWDLVYKVHLRGAYSVTKAAWPYMREQRYGRIIFVSSAAGLYGNFGQANYSSVKLAVVGFSNTLSKEGKSRNIQSNVIAPVAGSRMTETVMPPELVAALKPEYVAPVVVWLTHESCPETGGIFEVGGGWVSKVRLQRSDGVALPLNEATKAENFVNVWDKVGDFERGVSYPQSIQESTGTVLSHLNAAKEAATSSSSSSSSWQPKKQLPKNDNVDLNVALGAQLPDNKRELSAKDVVLYALAIGAASEAPTDPSELKFTYENSPDFTMIPSMGVTLIDLVDLVGGGLPGLSFNPMMLLHGEQYMEVLNHPLPTSGLVTSKAHIANVYDKGKAALVVLEGVTSNAEGVPIIRNKYSMFIRGIGGFGGERGPKPPSYKPPSRAPDAVITEKTGKNQALFYRLPSGDSNPLHVDPQMAAMGGFDKPILHGLCTFGFATRAVLKAFLDNDTTKFRAINVRFSGHVFPGETLTTEMWKEGNRIIFRTKTEERGKYVLSNAMVEVSPSAKL